MHVCMTARQQQPLIIALPVSYTDVELNKSFPCLPQKSSLRSSYYSR